MCFCRSVAVLQITYPLSIDVYKAAAQSQCCYYYAGSHPFAYMLSL